MSLSILIGVVACSLNEAGHWADLACAALAGWPLAGAGFEQLSDAAEWFFLQMVQTWTYPQATRLQPSVLLKWLQISLPKWNTFLRPCESCTCPVRDVLGAIFWFSLVLACPQNSVKWEILLQILQALDLSPAKTLQ